MANPQHMKDYQIQSVKNALRILRLFTVQQPEWGVTQISRALNLPTSTVQRLILELANFRYLKKNPATQKYQLGTKNLTLGGLALSYKDILRESAGMLESLTDRLRADSVLGVLEGCFIFDLHRVSYRQSLNERESSGSGNLAYQSSLGQAILAHMPESVRQEVLHAAIEQVPDSNCIPDADELKQRLEQIRTNGCAVCTTETVCSVGAPIRDYTGQVIAALGIEKPIQDVDDTAVSLFIGHVKDTAKEISKKLGYYSN
jgi:DNA-binding IclR family transcriptional regulator